MTSQAIKSSVRLWQRLLEFPTWQLGLLIFLLAFSLRLAAVLAFHVYDDPFRGELERTAISLATTGVFGNPYMIPTGATAHVAPGYTLILAGIFRVFGTGTAGALVRTVVAVAVSSLLWALMPAVASRFSLERSAGVLAGLAGALLPARLRVEADGEWETPYIALALVLILWLAIYLWKKHDLSAKQAVWQGFLWGLCLLFVPALLDIFVVFLLAGLYFCRRSGVRRYLIFAGIEVALVAICLSPWVIRNYFALGSPVITRTNLGLELRVSNNDEASPDQRVNALKSDFNDFHPLFSTREALRVRSLGEVAYNRWAGAEARKWIRTHPKRFLELCVGRARCYWLYNDPTSRPKTLLLGATVLLGFVGFVILWKRDRVVGSAVALVLLLYPLPNYLIHVGLRQEYPLHWLMTLLAAVAFVYACKRTQIPTVDQLSRATG